jgi:hypothetical protein
LENAKVEFEQEQKTRQQLEKAKKLLETELHALQVRRKRLGRIRCNLLL